MSAIGHEQKVMQNSALGAVLLWRFNIAYAETHAQHFAAPLPLNFLILPMIWHRTTSQTIASTQIKSGLRAFAAKFSNETPSCFDVLLSLHGRSLILRSKSLQAMSTGFASGLLKFNDDHRLIGENKEWKLNKQSVTAKEMCSRVEKIGAWFSPLTIHEISTILHIQF